MHVIKYAKQPKQKTLVITVEIVIRKLSRHILVSKLRITDQRLDTDRLWRSYENASNGVNQARSGCKRFWLWSAYNVDS